MGNSYRMNPTNANTLPNGRPRGYTYTIPFTTASNGSTFDINLATEDAMGNLNNLQSIYVDNSKNSASLVISTLLMGESITVPAGYQGIYPLYVTKSDTIKFLSQVSSPTNVTVILLDTPSDYASWSANPLSGTLDVDIVSGPGSSSSTPLYANVTNVVSTNDANLTGFSIGTATQSDTTASTLVPARSGITGFIDKITIIETANATLATAGIIDLEILDGTTVITSIPVYVPTAAISGSYAPITLDLKYNQLAADSALTVNLSEVLATGEFYLIANYK